MKHVLVREAWRSKVTQSGPSRASYPCPDRPLQIGFDLQIPIRAWSDPPALHSGEAPRKAVAYGGRRPTELQIDASSAAGLKSTFFTITIYAPELSFEFALKLQKKFRREVRGYNRTDPTWRRENDCLLVAVSNDACPFHDCE